MPSGDQLDHEIENFQVRFNQFTDPNTDYGLFFRGSAHQIENMLIR